MKKILKKIFAFIISIMTVCYLIFAPAYIIPNLNENAYLEWMMKSRERTFSGIIKVWHIVGFKSYQGSVSLTLSKWAEKIEKKNFGVFFDIEAMTTDEFLLRRQKGERADIYSFPLGLIKKDDFIDIKEYIGEYNFRGNMGEIGLSDEKVLAVPYLYSCYAAICNTEHKSSDIINSIIDSDSNIVTGENLKSIYEKSKIPICGNETVIGLMDYNGHSISSNDEFTSSNALMSISDLRYIGDIIRRYNNGKGFSYNTYAIDNDFTDEVQLIGVDSNIEKEKITYVAKLIDYALSENGQKDVMALKSFPVIENVAVDFNGDDMINSLFNKLNEPTIINTFDYSENKERLFEKAKEFIISENNQKNECKELFKLLCLTNK